MKFKVGDKVKVIGPLRSAGDVGVGYVGVITGSMIGTVGDYERKPVYCIDDKISGWVGEDAIVEYGAVGTLKELDVKPGDVLQWVGDLDFPCTVTRVSNLMVYMDTPDGSIDYSLAYCTDPWRIISRASETPKLWRNMTPEEKGALLLAAHEGKDIEYWKRGSGGWALKPITWSDHESYRIRPEPKIETYPINMQWNGYKGKATLTVVDGIPQNANLEWTPIE